MIWAMASRNIFRNKRRTLLTLSMMSFGFVLFSFQVSLVDGTYGNFIDQFIRERTGHLQIHVDNYLDTPKIYKTIKNYNQVLNDLSKLDSVESSAPRIHSGGLVFFKKRSMGAQIKAIDANLEEKVTTIKKRIMKGSYFSSNDAYEVLVGKGVASVLKLELGSKLVLISQGADGSIANDIFKVVAVIGEKQKGLDDQLIYMPLKTGQEFLSLYEQVHEIVVIKNESSVLDDVVRQLKNVLTVDKLNVEPWQVVEKDFYKAMEADKKGDAIGQMIFNLIIALGVFNTILMSILERQREFGIIRAIGTRPQFIRKIIFLEVMLMCTVSIIIGAILATFINFYFSKYGITLDTPINWGGVSFDKMRGVVNLKCYTYPARVIFISTFFVCLYPAWKASTVSPVEAMREV
ncbi:ABC transporter permease [Bacteriovoracaceae bacterium]|nr:ABC transporter permease [Bacteriovoracaceae bacterium]